MFWTGWPERGVGAWIQARLAETLTIMGKGRKAGWPERGDGRVGILVGDVGNHRG